MALERTFDQDGAAARLAVNAAGTAFPHGHWKTTTFPGALRLTGMTAPIVPDGAMNGIASRPYVEQVLVPTLFPGDIVIMATCRRARPKASASRSNSRR